MRLAIASSILIISAAVVWLVLPSTPPKQEAEKLGAISQPIPEITDNKFTVIQIPDSDEISRYCRATSVWNDMMDAIVASSTELNLKVVMSPGDVHGEVVGSECSNDLDDGQFPYISAGYNILASNSIPFLISPANHDHDNDGCYPRDTSTWDATYASTTFTSQTGFLSLYDEKTHSMANMQSIDGYDVMFITLEQIPSNAVIAWMDNLIAQNTPDYVILGMQEVLQPDNAFADILTTNPNLYSGQTGRYEIEDVSNEFAAKYPGKIILTFGQSYLDTGKTDREWGGKYASSTGNGITYNFTSANFGLLTGCTNKAVLRYHVIDPDDGTIDVYTYNPVTETSYTSDTATEHYEFTMNFKAKQKDKRFKGWSDSSFSNVNIDL